MLYKPLLGFTRFTRVGTKADGGSHRDRNRVLFLSLWMPCSVDLGQECMARCCKTNPGLNKTP